MLLGRPYHSLGSQRLQTTWLLTPIADLLSLLASWVLCFSETHSFLNLVIFFSGLQLISQLQPRRQSYPAFLCPTSTARQLSIPTPTPTPTTARQTTKGNVSCARPLLTVSMPDPAADTGRSKLQKRHGKLRSRGIVVPVMGTGSSSGLMVTT